MRHSQKNRKFGRVRKQRTALLRELANSLIERRRITTSEARAKELRPYIEKLVTLARKETIASKRIIAARLNTDSARLLYGDISKKFANRHGGYTRIIKLPARKSDASKRALIEFV